MDGLGFGGSYASSLSNVPTHAATPNDNTAQLNSVLIGHESRSKVRVDIGVRMGMVAPHACTLEGEDEGEGEGEGEGQGQGQG